MSLETTEAEAAAVAKHPDGRVKLTDIEAAISTISYRTGAECVEAGGGPTTGSMATLSVAFVVMKNGYIVIGKSAPLDPANYNMELGRKFAYEDAVRQIWPLMAFYRAQANRQASAAS